MVRILLVATARGAVYEMVRAVRAAGLRATTADLAPLALVRAAAAAGRREALARAAEQGRPGELPPPRTEAVIDVGSDKVAVAVHTGGVPHFVRVAAGLGGDGLTHTLVAATGMEWDQAERLKREAAIAKRLDKLDRRMTRMERDVGIGVEMIALFVRFWLSNTPPPPESERAAMRRRGGDRYDAFMEALGRRLAKGPKVRQEIGEDFPHQEE